MTGAQDPVRGVRVKYAGYALPRDPADHHRGVPDGKDTGSSPRARTARRARGTVDSRCLTSSYANGSWVAFDRSCAVVHARPGSTLGTTIPQYQAVTFHAPTGTMVFADQRDDTLRVSSFEGASELAIPVGMAGISSAQGITASPLASDTLIVADGVLSGRFVSATTTAHILERGSGQLTGSITLGATTMPLFGHYDAVAGTMVLGRRVREPTCAPLQAILRGREQPLRLMSTPPSASLIRSPGPTASDVDGNCRVHLHAPALRAGVLVPAHERLDGHPPVLWRGRAVGHGLLQRRLRLRSARLVRARPDLPPSGRGTRQRAPSLAHGTQQMCRTR